MSEPAPQDRPEGGPAGLTPEYVRLLELAELRLELVEDGRYDEAAAAGEEQLRLLESLPGQVGDDARPLLERLERLTRRTQEQAQVALDRVGHDLASLRTTKPALLAYAAAPEPHAVDRRG